MIVRILELASGTVLNDGCHSIPFCFAAADAEQACLDDVHFVSLKALRIGLGAVRSESSSASPVADPPSRASTANCGSAASTACLSSPSLRCAVCSAAFCKNRGVASGARVAAATRKGRRRRGPCGDGAEGVRVAGAHSAQSVLRTHHQSV